MRDSPVANFRYVHLGKNIAWCHEGTPRSRDHFAQGGPDESSFVGELLVKLIQSLVGGCGVTCAGFPCLPADLEMHLGECVDVGTLYLLFERQTQ